MRCKNLFALGVRLIGVWLMTRGITYVASFAELKLYPPSDKARDAAAANLIYATFDFALAAFFLIWTRVIVAWSYGEKSGVAEEDEAGVENGTGGQLDEPGGSQTPDV
ncbi:MAG: hypothetical protein ACHRXM_27095 [Isosphaerales bacterium]